MTKHRRYPFNGELLSLAEIARRTGIRCGTLWGRIHVTGLSPEEAFSKPNCASGQSLEQVMGRTRITPFQREDHISREAQGAFNWRMLTELEKLERRQQDLNRDISELRQKLKDGVDARTEREPKKSLA